MVRRIVLALLSMWLLALPAWARPAGKAAPPADWTHVVAATPAGGFVLGNPRAKVKLVEYGSLSCPHCRAFDKEGVPTLLSDYVRSGRVSWEFRNYVRDPFDLTAALIARCGGPRSFFPLTRLLYDEQPVWVGKAIATPKEKLEQLAQLPPQQQYVALAKLMELDSFATKHGLAGAKVNQCLSNLGGVDKLVAITGKAMQLYPDFPGTPTFVINGAMVKDVASWDGLEPQLKAALGG